MLIACFFFFFFLIYGIKGAIKIIKIDELIIM